MNRVCPVPGGRLNVKTHREMMPMEQLLGFAARENPLRPFLFVSRVLGRHIPARPSTMRETYKRLAEPLAALPGPIWVMGMAETATGLGLGVADSLVRESGRSDVYAQHTTRHRGDFPPLLIFKESHSHAPMHIVQQPAHGLLRAFEKARTLVIVDDEVSTGRSVESLARGLLGRMPMVQHLAFVNLVDWLTPVRRNEIGEILAVGASRAMLDVRWTSLMEGSFTFIDDGDSTELRVLPGNVHPQNRAVGVRGDLGRQGMRMPAHARLDLRALGYADGLPPMDEPLTVIGTGECAFEPFLFAELLEGDGYDVHLQCISRSPAQRGGAILDTLDCQDPYGEGVGYYLHNPPSPTSFCIAVHEEPIAGPLAADGHAWMHLQIPAHASDSER